jgi:DHA1 family bicyclomycin/chloramphenicol resistance-like MFS transporter
LARDLHTSDSLAQTTMSACMLGLAPGQLVAGPLSDRLGRRRPLLAGIAVFTALSLVCAAAPTIGVLVVARFLQGVAGSAGIVVSLATARDLADGVELVRLLALLGAVGALAPILAPVVGGQLAAVMDWRGIFVVLAGIGLALFTYLASISFVLQDGFRLSPQLLSLCFAGNAVMSVIGAQVNRAVVRRAGPARMYTIGITTTALTALLMLGTVLLHLGLAALVCTLAAAMFFSGTSMSNGSALALADHGARAGTAAALLGTTSFAVGPVVAPLVSLGGATARTMTLTMALGYACATTLVWSAVRPGLRHRRPVAVVAVALTATAGNPM